NSVAAYWRQQRGYGRAEALLERKWPERYNAAGHISWAGRIYGPTPRLHRRPRSLIYQGTWGAAAFQGARPGRRGALWSLPATPARHLGIASPAPRSALGAMWSPRRRAIRRT